MPVTAKLSRQFYEKFGDEITNELVTWFNQVDATYRNDLRELNELNFQRFDAKLQQRVAAAEARLDKRISELRAEMQVGFANLERGMVTRIGNLETRMEQRLGAQEQRLGAQMKWMFGFWLGTLLPLAGLMIALQRWGG
jgi:hypothetical protein